MKFAALFGCSILLAAPGVAEVAVTLPKDATPPQMLAASELVSYLSKIYPDERFTTAAGTSAAAVVEFVYKPGSAEGYEIRRTTRGAVIASGPRGALPAVYALLEKLGCGFYLSSETLPPPRRGGISFEDWELHDEPVFADRIVFDWHNFLSSASTWEFEDWQSYIDHSARMRFNGLMVHAYGNNPMFTFQFGGKQKPIGYLATTRAGRDWGTQHVNDVRRLIGGDHFSDPVFGASIAKVPEPERVPAARALMQRVFDHAASRGLGITFALDVDTLSANPQELIAALSPSARITSGNYHLANPDTPEGYAYYRAQVEQLFAAYPQITRLAIWFRNNATPWTEIKLDEFPPSWKGEFSGEPVDASMFAIGKLVTVYGRALKETGHANVALAAGSWRLTFLKSADRYLPREAELMPLDWSTVFDTAAGQRALREVRSGRRLIPIVWAHHDDRTYIGRPYTPYVNFSSLVQSAGGSGFGIIHWTTRPLDLYFKSTVTQAWQATVNQPLETTCDEMALRLFGAPGREKGRDYLFSFVTEGPMFGRETTDQFMDIPLADPAAHIQRSRARLALLDQIPAGPLRDYFRHYESFLLAFFETQIAFERATAALKAGDYTKLRTELAATHPEDVIRKYVLAAKTGGPTGGEKAIVVSLNLRWLPYFVSLRQAAGLEPVRYLAGKVEVEPLAQGAGHNTFHVDEEGRMWKVVDPATLKPPVRMGTIMGHQLEPGWYTVNGAPPRESREGHVELALTGHPAQIVITRVPAP